MRGGTFFTVLAFAAFASGTAGAMTVMHPTVAELFTSQGCSSCPPADALLKQKAAADPELLVLSYHVNYWDHLGWKDAFSLQGSTDRQRGYYNALHQNTFYTPELVVNGAASMIGSDENKVNAALAGYKLSMPLFNIEVEPLGAKGKLQALINATGSGAAGAPAEAWEVTYLSYARTSIGAGENEGRMIENIDNVTSVTKLGALNNGAGRFELRDLGSRKDMIAIIVQGQDQGPLLAAATYEP